MKKVLVPIFILGLYAAIVVACASLGPTDSAVTGHPVPTVTTTLEPTANPSPTATRTPSVTSGSPSAVTGERAPDFTLPSAQGDMITLSGYRGQKNVVLVFYRTGG